MEGSNRGTVVQSAAISTNRISPGIQLRERAFTRELYVSDPTRAPEIATRQPDYVIPGTRRTLDIKTGYASGDFDRNQLLDYNDLVIASRNPNNTRLQTQLREYGIQGGLTGHDYLFLPNATSSAEGSARLAYQRITRDLRDDAQNFGIYYLGNDGNIYKFLGVDQNGGNLRQLVGPGFPR